MLPDVTIAQAVFVVGLVFAWAIYVLARGLSKRP